MFLKSIEAGHALVARLEHYKHTSAGGTSIATPLADTDFREWAKDAKGLVLEVFGESSPQMHLWNEVDNRFNVSISAALCERLSGALASSIQDFQQSIRLLSEFDLYLTSRENPTNLADVDVISDLQITSRDHPQSMLQRGKLSFPSETAPAFRLKRVHIQTASDVLSKLTNDYSEKEVRFLRGVNLVDWIDEQELTKRDQAEAKAYREHKTAVLRNFVQHEPNLKGLSVIIPVARDRKEEFLCCLKSILQQTLITHHPELAEILVIQDGETDDPDNGPICSDLLSVTREFRSSGALSLYIVSSHMSETEGRSATRNVGVYFGQRDVAFFIDSSMVLENTFFAEHMMRHQDIPAIALIGFKQKISLAEYYEKQREIELGSIRPDYRQDWKWFKELKRKDFDEKGFFEYKGLRYREGDSIRYMEISQALKALRGDEWIGKTMTSRFFHTGITSVSLGAVKRVGGFESSFDPLWGFEDSFLGALLMTCEDIKLVPCPSSLAFQIDHSDDPTKQLGIEYNGEQFKERLDKIPLSAFNANSLRDKILSLTRSHMLKRVKYTAKGRRSTEQVKSP